MPNQSTQWNALVAEAIGALFTPGLPRVLVKLLEQATSFDCALMLGYGRHHKPIYLYDSVAEHRDMIFDAYLNGAYQLDPFYNAFLDGAKSSVYLLSELAPDRFKQSEYYQAFYANTGWQDEVGLIVNINDDLTVAIFLGSLGQCGKLSADDLARLRDIYPIIEHCCLQHWKKETGELSNSPEHAGRSGNLKQQIEAAFLNFGEHQLTARESEIVRLILMGHSSKFAALRLHISEGTVKNHRKSIYAKLGIASQSELFLRFINYLIVTEQPAPRDFGA
ncbi:MAG: LuxR C-terminal-related transcriptional regulator [Halopseudomonas sp.]